MKKPVEAIEWMRSVGLSSGSARSILAYLDSIPDDADWHGKWPEWLTKRLLLESAKTCDLVSMPTTGQHLRALAALAPIAPEKPKKRKVALYEFLGHGDGSTQYGAIVGFTHDGPMPGGFPWRKVGECEIEE